MFTGIIEEIGTVRNIRRGRNSVALTIGAPHIVEGTRIGDSIAVNGICLTVTDMQTDSFSADVMHETMNRSSLASLVAGQRVNLERAMPADGRFGGHIVSGHVDGMGQIYPQEFEPTPVVIRDNQERVSYIDVPVVGLVHLNLDMYPDFSVEVKNVKSGKVRKVLASNRIGGALNNTVGYVEPREGVFRFPLRAKSTDVTCRIIVESPHTFQLRDIEWEGSYNPTRRRV